MKFFRFRITVTQLVADENLTKNDDRLDNPSGIYEYDALTEDDALDEFHNHIAIACLDDFRVDIEPAPLQRQPRSNEDNMTPADPLTSRDFSFGTVELTHNPHSGGWLWRCAAIGAEQWSAIGYRTRDDAYSAAVRFLRAKKG